MREVYVSHLEPGDVLDKPVFARNGVVMLEEGTVLTEPYIQSLKRIGIDRVRLRSRKPGVAWPEDANDRSGETESEYRLPDISALKSDVRAREDAVRLATAFADSDLGLGRMSMPFPVEVFRKQFREIVMGIVSQPAFAEELGVLYLTDRQLFEHSLQVALCSDIIGTIRNFDASRRYALTLGAMFSDIGMTRLPTELLKLPRELKDPERAIIKRHTTDGYRLLTRMKEMPAESAKCALLHHERYQGGGYPLALKNSDIPEYAQIVGLADVYNALLSPRHHRQPYAREEALEYLYAAGNWEFEAQLIRLFLNSVKGSSS
ncbi:HD-GYP domain-containing protein [Cohnella faecalis]|nr:HD domain-containing phosphohydrolase [Cohnella faecalis]